MKPHTHKHPPTQLDGLVHTLHSLYENQIHRLDHKHTQLKADSEQRDTSTAKLLRGLEEENERLVETNQALLAELGELRTRCRRVETSLKVCTGATVFLIYQAILTTILGRGHL